MLSDLIGMFNFNIEKLISTKATIFLIFIGLILFWFSFQIPEPLGESVYWVSIITFSIGILVFSKKIIAQLKKNKKEEKNA